MTRRFISFPIFTSIILMGALLVTGWSLPGHADPNSALTSGQWKQRTQLVWDNTTRTMLRKTLKVWDAQPERNLDFYFEPAIGQTLAKEAVISGKGVLTWRIRGTASYDKKAVFSSYDGELVNGRYEGNGRLVLRSGTTYTGGFKNGLMHGLGSLHSQNGDQYEGQFAYGKPHGKGRYAYASGEIYDGEFKAGKRHGKGILTLDGGRRRVSQWADGMENRSLMPVVPAQWADGSTDPFANKSRRTDLKKISVSVVTDQKRYRRMKNNYLAAIPYGHQIGRNSVSIQPSDKKLLAIWKGDGWMYDNNDWMAGYNREDDIYRFPIYLQIALKNRASKAAVIDRIELKFTKSSTDREPFLGVKSDNGLKECSGTDVTKFNPVIDFNNTGWGAAEKASISFSFTSNEKPGRVKKYAFQRSVGSVAKSKSTSVEKALKKSDVDVAALKKFHFKCPSYKQIKSCRAQVMKKLQLGKLKGRTRFVRDSRLVTNVEGRMNYRWTDSAGKKHQDRKKFSVPILLAKIKVGDPAECGAGGPEDPKAGIPIFKLKLNKKNYSLRYPLRRKLRLTKRGLALPFGVKVGKSSNHLFRVVVRFKDGSKKLSKPIKLLYARPKK